MMRQPDDRTLEFFERRVHELEELVRPLVVGKLRYGQPEVSPRMLQRAESGTINDGTTSSTLEDIAGATVDLTVREGSLVKVFLKPLSSAAAVAGVTAESTTAQLSIIPSVMLQVDGSDAGQIDVQLNGASAALVIKLPPFVFYWEYNVVAAGTKTFSLQAAVGANEQITFTDCVLVVEEWRI